MRSNAPPDLRIEMRWTIYAVIEITNKRKSERERERELKATAKRETANE